MKRMNNTKKNSCGKNKEWDRHKETFKLQLLWQVQLNSYSNTILKDSVRIADRVALARYIK